MQTAVTTRLPAGGAESHPDAASACALANTGSGISFLIVWFLYGAEGRSRPDVQFQLSSPTGQTLFVHTTVALAVATIPAAVGAVALHSRLWSLAALPSALAIVLTTMASAFMLAVLSL